VDEQLRIDLGDGVREIAQRRDPGAVNRLTSAAQRAVDRFDGIARGAHNNERNRVLVSQSGLHELREEKIRRVIVPPEKPRSGMYWFSWCNIRLSD
jgi:hypothetical protein